VLEAKGRPILKDFIHRCGFCGQGQYEFVNGPEDKRENQATSYEWDFKVPVVNRRRTNYSNNFFMIALCNKCGHTQLFRPDLVPGAAELWMRKSGKS
jgi:hypothetical protein